MRINNKSLSKNDEVYTIQVVHKSFQVLNAFLDAKCPIGLEEICKLTGLPKSTAYRIIKTLIHENFVVETEDGYWLGVLPIRLGAYAESRLDFLQSARPILRKLRDQFNETVHLAILDNEFRVVYLEKLSSTQAIGVMSSKRGVIAPYYCTGLGKAIISFLPQEKINKALDFVERRKFTPNTITDEKALLNEFAKVRKDGYAIDNSEHEEEVYCIAAPIFDKFGNVVASISVAGPMNRIKNSKNKKTIVDAVLNYSNLISISQGYSGIINEVVF